MMQLPNGVGPAKRYLWGRYPLRALTREGISDLADQIRPVNEEIRTLGRELEDLQAPVEEALCDRDNCDNQLDDLARVVRVQLLARGPQLEKEEPYVSIFPDGLEGVVEANLDEQLDAYGLLISRINANLAVDDATRVTLVPQLTAKLAEWEAAEAAVRTAEQVRDVGARRLEQAVTRWEKTMLEVYAQLVARTGSRKKADRFFPRARKAKKQAASAPAEGSAPEAAAK